MSRLHLRCTGDRNTRGILACPLLAFIPIWVWWEFAIRVGSSLSNPLTFQFVVLPGAFATVIAALIMRRWVAKKDLADSGLRLRVVRGRPYYPVGCLQPCPCWRSPLGWLPVWESPSRWADVRIPVPGHPRHCGRSLAQTTARGPANLRPGLGL
jgi:hypothetical protein